jgi:hypothetical protein
MAITRHVTFANLTSAIALALVLAGGGYAVASGELAKNSVGSAQLKKSAVHSSDIKDDAVTGKDVKESSLGTVPSAAQAQTAGRATSAASVDKLFFAPKVTAAFGQTVTIATKGPLTVSLECIQNAPTAYGFIVQGTTSVNGAAFASGFTGQEINPMDVADSMVLAHEIEIAPDAPFAQIGFTALTPDGQQWQGFGMATANLGGSGGCTAEMEFIG